MLRDTEVRQIILFLRVIINCLRLKVHRNSLLLRLVMIRVQFRGLRVREIRTIGKEPVAAVNDERLF